MTLREIVTVGDDPKVVLIGAMQIFRSLEQMEAATLEGCCASSLEWIRQYGKPTKDSLEQWLGDIGKLADQEIPYEMIVAWIGDC